VLCGYGVVWVCAQIYNEEPRDLLADPATPTAASAASGSSAPTPKGSTAITFVPRSDGTLHATNLTRLCVRSAADIHELLKAGTERRATSATKMNEQSSRSHAVFTLEIECCTDLSAPAKDKEKEGESNSNASGSGSSKQLVERVVSSLHLVDLAGSESAKNSGASMFVSLFECFHSFFSLASTDRPSNRALFCSVWCW
jgi:hypothetical protein